MSFADLRRRGSTARLAILGSPALALLLVAFLVPLLSRPVSAEQESDPEIQATLAAMNLYRDWLGLEPMTIDPALQAAAEAHAEYYRLNYGDPNLSGMGLHMETPGKPGFTGADMQDRAEAQGYEGWVNENVGLSGSMLASLDWFMDTINHRLPIIDPRYTEVGLATVNDGEIVFEIIAFGMPEWEEFSEPEWTIWPPNGTTGVGRSFWGEAPNPFAGATFPTGVPITISHHGEGGIQLSDWTVTANGAEIASFGSVGTGFLSQKAAMIVASEPLEPGTTYAIQASGTAGSEPFDFSWSFTTKATDDEPLALDGVSAPEPGEVTPPAEETPEPSLDRRTAIGPPLPAPPTEDDPSSPYPTGLQHSAPEVQEQWMAVDGPVYQSETARSWLWGPDVWAVGDEPYQDTHDGDRTVYYFDKARIELSDEEASAGERSLTSGLLVRDMIQGAAQVGDDDFVKLGPADVPLAGDALKFNENAPTYASLAGLASLDEPNVAEQRTGARITATLSASGEVGERERLGELARYGSYEPTLGHNIAAVFEDYFETLPLTWEEMIGLPLTEPYWVRTNVDGDPTWVLVQAFERRLLTYTPTNEPAWRVEMGNVGRHYYEWRYLAEPPEQTTKAQVTGSLALTPY